MSERFAVTWLGTNNPGKRFDENANFDVYEFSADKKLDDGERDYLWGSDGSIIEQASTVKAIHDSLSRRFGFNIKFEEFWNFWEAGFKGFERKSKVAGLRSNYPENDIKEGDTVVAEAWRKDRATRPGYIEWIPKSKTQFPLRIIEYFPDRSNESVSELFVGSDWTIIRDIIQYEYEGGLGNVELSGETGLMGEAPLMGGHPMVTLYFAASQLLPNHRMPTRSRISFRLMDKVESSEYAYSGETVLTKADKDQLIQRIRTKYVVPRYQIERGDSAFSYSHRQAGYSFWNPLKNRTEAIRVYSDILSLRNHILDPNLIKESFKPARASTVPDKTLTVLGEPQTVRVGFKNEVLRFTHAILHLPVSRQRLTLAISQVAERIT